ncbi:hypothetical protein TGDOM2_400080, partial [Toxoplasma gondii GAB2-2007-GAL-DOM2]
LFLAPCDCGVKVNADASISFVQAIFPQSFPSSVGFLCSSSPSSHLNFTTFLVVHRVVSCTRFQVDCVVTRDHYRALTAKNS